MFQNYFFVVILFLIFAAVFFEQLFFLLVCLMQMCITKSIALKNISFNQTPQKQEFAVVLLLAGTESVFFLVAGMTLCLGFRLRISCAQERFRCCTKEHG